MFLIYFYEKNILSNRASFSFLLIDILQLSLILYFSGGVINPFSIFLIIPSIFSSSNLSLKTNILLVFLTICSIFIQTFYSLDLPSPISDHFHVSPYYYYSIPIALIVALIFLS